MSDQPQLAPSAEADERQIELAREAGEAYQRAADYMIEEVANTGDRAREGDTSSASPRRKPRGCTTDGTAT